MYYSTWNRNHQYSSTPDIDYQFALIWIYSNKTIHIYQNYIPYIHTTVLFVFMLGDYTIISISKCYK